MSDLRTRAEYYLRALVHDIGARPVGSAANARATDVVFGALRSLDWRVEQIEFPCLDWQDRGSQLEFGGRQYAIFTGPFSPAISVEAPVAVAATVTELAELSDTGSSGAILLLHGAVAAEQLFPKNYPFFQVPEHQEIYRLIEACKPCAVLTATGRNQALTATMYPFPMIEDGDFAIASAFMTAEEGALLIEAIASGASAAAASLQIDSQRSDTTGANVIARNDAGLAVDRGADSGTIVFTAHIDTKPGTPGALDNAAGVVVLLLLAELLDKRSPTRRIELAILNGEDHYAAPGQVAYLAHTESSGDQPVLAVNVDGVGLVNDSAAFSLYQCPVATAAALRTGLAAVDKIVEGPIWYQGDHMLFVQRGVPALALTTADLERLTGEIAHTAADDLSNVDIDTLVSIAQALAAVASIVVT